MRASLEASECADPFEAPEGSNGSGPCWVLRSRLNKCLVFSFLSYCICLNTETWSWTGWADRPSDFLPACLWNITATRPKTMRPTTGNHDNPACVHFHPNCKVFCSAWKQNGSKPNICRLLKPVLGVKCVLGKTNVNEGRFNCFLEEPQGFKCEPSSSAPWRPFCLLCGSVQKVHKRLRGSESNQRYWTLTPEWSSSPEFLASSAPWFQE